MTDGVIHFPCGCRAEFDPQFEVWAVTTFCSRHDSEAGAYTEEPERQAWHTGR
jgi:hypothetical protein